MPAEHGFVEPAETPDLDQKLDEAFGPESNLADTLKRNLAAAEHATDQPVAREPSPSWLPPLPDFQVPRGGIGFGPIKAGPGEIYARMAAAMNEVSHVGKTGFNQQQGYNFRGIDAVVNALGPAMRKWGIVPVPKLLKAKYRDTLTTGQKPTREVTVQVKYSFIAPDGSCIDTVVPGESLDQSDKGTAKAMSVAYRIALLQVFALPTDEPDPDASYHTRDGVGAMGGATAALVYGQLVEADPDRVEALWTIIAEHAAAERPALSSDSGLTWAEAFAERLAALIEQAETWEDGRKLNGVLKRTGLDGLRCKGATDTVRHLLEARADFIKERTAKTFDHVMKQITKAGTPEELATAIGCGSAALEAGTLSAKQFEELRAVARDRDDKLDAAAHKQRWEHFCKMADQAASEPDARELLYGSGTVTAAGVFELAGFQRVYDVVVRLHARDHAIGDEDRAALVEDLGVELERNGIAWPAGWKR